MASRVSPRFIVINFIRLLLLIGIVISIMYNRDLVLLMSLIGFAVTFVPFISARFFKIAIPAEFEIIVLLFVYGLFIFAEMWGFYAGFFWLGLVFNFGAGILLGFVALSVMYALEDEELLELTPFIIVVFTFCFSFSIGGLWEIFEYCVDVVFGFTLQHGSLEEVMIDLMIVSVSALFVAILGFYNYTRGRRIFSMFLFSAVKKNRKLFGARRDSSYYEKLISRIIAAGENEKVEFKATLRKNLHTKETDKKIEHSVLKTITGFLNTKGGTLLVGVSDDGSVTGLSDDDFSSHDKLKIYLTGILRSHLGNQYLPHIQFDVHQYAGKEVLFIHCKASTKRVFLKWQGAEEFYVRHGASTLQLQGSALIDYVGQRFR